MLEKPKRPTKPKIQDRLQPTTIEELIRKYDLENKGVYDFLDKMVDYINLKSEIKVSEVLWENPNPSIAFEDNTIINLKNSNYDYLEVFFIFSISEANLKNQQSTSCIKGNSVTLYSIGYSTGAMVRRILDYVDDVTYKARNGRRDSSNNNECCIPIKVVGHKLIIK